MEKQKELRKSDHKSHISWESLVEQKYKNTHLKLGLAEDLIFFFFFSVPKRRQKKLEHPLASPKQNVFIIVLSTHSLQWGGFYWLVISTCTHFIGWFLLLSFSLWNEKKKKLVIIYILYIIWDFMMNSMKSIMKWVHSYHLLEELISLTLYILHGVSQCLQWRIC